MDQSLLSKPAKYCAKHQTDFTFQCEGCAAGEKGIITAMGPELPLLPRAFDTHKEALRWIEEWLPEGSVASAYRIKHELGAFSWVMMRTEEKVSVLCGFRELYWRELKPEEGEGI